MNLQLRLDGNGLRRWHLRLLERLSAKETYAIAVDVSPGSHAPPPKAELLFQLETAIHGLPRGGLSAAVDAKDLAPFQTTSRPAPDLILDLRGDVQPGPVDVWRLAFDGVPGERGLLASLLSGRAPLATIAQGDALIATGRLGTESPGILLSSFEDGLARTITLIIAALDGAASKTLPSSDDEALSTHPPRLGLAVIGERTAKILALRLIRRLSRLCYYAPHWRVGWRRVTNGDLIDLRRHPQEGWHDLPDDGLRFYADPFPLERQGVVTLFVEDYDHRRQKGIISAVAFGPEGPIGRPEPVLDLPHHLSYPFVFERDGEVWMIPESCAAGTIDLYRATDFPRGWVHETTLVENVVASDATLLQHADRWWLFATVRDEGGAFSDALHLWSAPDFRGPWSAHPRNPVLIDIASARSAGRIVEREGRLIRPVQDCRKGYGHALGLARILRLDDERYEQRVETVLYAGPSWPGTRLHTLNRAGDFEFIDGSARARRGFLG